MATYKIDPTHSEITFKVKHLMISTVTGAFTKFDATLESDIADFSDAKITFEADVNSISTSNEQRDGHLKSDDFFNAEQFPTMRFVSTGITKNGDSEFVLNGNLTIRDQTHPLSLKTSYAGTVTDSYGQTKAGFEMSGTLSRKDFGLKWSATTEAGNIVVSDEVRLQMDVQMVKAA
jgi:polyisoprenoid-binding protein YceI